MSHSILCVTLLVFLCSSTFAAQTSYPYTCGSINLNYVSPNAAASLNDGDFVQVTVNRGTTLVNDILFITDSTGNVIYPNNALNHFEQSGVTQDSIQLLSTTLGAIQTRYIKYLACAPNSGIIQTSSGFVCGTNNAQVCATNGELFTINPVAVQLVSGNPSYFPNTPNLPNPFTIPIEFGRVCIEIPPLNFYHPSTVSVAFLSVSDNWNTYTSNCEVTQVGSRTSAGAVRLWQVTCRPCLFSGGTNIFSANDFYPPTFVNIHTLNVGDSNQVYQFNYQASMCGLLRADINDGFTPASTVFSYQSYEPIDVPLEFLLFSNVLTGAVTTTIAGFTYNCNTQPFIGGFGISLVSCNPADLSIVNYLAPGKYIATTTATTAFTSCSSSVTIEVRPTSCGVFSLSPQVALPGQTVTINYNINELITSSTTKIDIVFVVNSVPTSVTIDLANIQPITFVAPTTISTIPYDISVSACSQSSEYCAVCSTNQNLQLYVGSFFGTQPQLSASTLSLSDTLFVNQFAVQSTQAIANQLSVSVNWGDSTSNTCKLLSTDLSNFYTVSCPKKDYQVTGSFTVTFTASYGSVSQTVTRPVTVTAARSCGALTIPSTTIEGSLTRVIFTPEQTALGLYTYLVTVNWGDGTTLTYSSDVNRNYDITHVYGGATSSVNAQVTVTANYPSDPSINAIKCSLTQSQTIAITNVAPKIDKWQPTKTAVKSIPWFPAVAHCSDRGFANTQTATITYGTDVAQSCTVTKLNDGKFDVDCPSKTFNAVGTYVVVLKVTDQWGAFDSKSVSVVVS